MTIQKSLGEALLVKTKVLNKNQSPNAIAKGDLFYLLPVQVSNLLALFIKS
jgi:hypothetical protein